MSRTQNALKRNIEKLAKPQKKKPVRKRKPKEEEIKWTKSKKKELFPYETFPWRLEDRKENKVCHFQCFEHVEKYIRRYDLKKKQYKLQERV